MAGRTHYLLSFVMAGLLALFFNACVTSPTGESQSWTANLSASQTGAVAVGSDTYYSSTSLAVTWDAPTGADISTYSITAYPTEDESRALVTEVTGPATSATITGLQADTDYTITISATQGLDMLTPDDANATVTTPQEVWQHQGVDDPATDDSYADSYLITGTDSDSDSSPITEAAAVGNSWAQSGSYTLAYVDGSGNNQYKLYFGAAPTSEWGHGEVGEGMRIATNTTNSTDVSLYETFEVQDRGIKAHCAVVAQSATEHCEDGDINYNTSQPIPLADGTTVRLIFEAVRTEVLATAPFIKATSTLYSIDSHDTAYGESFATDGTADYVCNDYGENDLAPGGKCAAKVLIASEAADAAANSGGSAMVHTRQSKVGYPELTDWKWDESEGTFMVMSGESVDRCGARSAIFYAVLDSDGNWQMDKTEYDATAENPQATDCPKELAAEGHGPTLVHLGGVRYKMYYEAGSTMETSTTEKPLKVLYADGALTGDPDKVEFEDWENEANAHDVLFLYPSGEEVPAVTETLLGDHDILTAGFDLNNQYMSHNIERFVPMVVEGYENAASFGIGYSKLINP